MRITNRAGIHWGARGRARIAQNVQNLLQIYRYEVPYHRTMGLPGAVFDRPGPTAAAELEVEVWQLLARYEPRAQVQRVTVDWDPATGEMTLEVEIS
mgnify:CR=1 FL=1